MANVFTLDSFREEAENEFAPVKIELSDGSQVTLRNLLRLSKKERDAVLEKLESLKGLEDSESGELSDVDTLTTAAIDILKLVADNGRKLAKELNGDVILIMRVLEAWLEATQPGEAQNSPA